MSADGHPVRGAFTFAIGPGPGTPKQFAVPSLRETAATPGLLAARWGVLLALMASVVAGLGINVSLRAGELPVPTAGSLALAGAEVTDRQILLRGLLREFAELYGEWRAAAGDPHASGLLPAYTARCTTLGLPVRVQLPGDRELAGEAVAVDGAGP